MPTTVRMKKSGKTKVVSEQVAQSMIREGEAEFVSKTPDVPQQGYLQRQLRAKTIKTK